MLQKLMTNGIMQWIQSLFTEKIGEFIGEKAWVDRLWSDKSAFAEIFAQSGDDGGNGDGGGHFLSSTCVGSKTRSRPPARVDDRDVGGR